MQRLTLGFVSKSSLAIHEYQVTGPSTTPERVIKNRTMIHVPFSESRVHFQLRPRTQAISDVQSF
jgi:hypothetical protein